MKSFKLDTWNVAHFLGENCGRCQNSFLGGCDLVRTAMNAEFGTKEYPYQIVIGDPEQGEPSGATCTALREVEDAESRPSVANGGGASVSVEPGPITTPDDLSGTSQGDASIVVTDEPKKRGRKSK